MLISLDLIDGEVGVKGGLLGFHRGLRDVIDDTTMNALFNQETNINITETQLRHLTCVIFRPRIAT